MIRIPVKAQNAIRPTADNDEIITAEPAPAISIANPQPEESLPEEEPIDEYAGNEPEALPVVLPDSAYVGRDAVISVVLPFGLADETVSKQAGLFTDFYKGMLLAAESMNAEGTPVSLRIYDSASLPTIGQLLESSVIIAPEESSEMKAICNSVEGTDTYVLNVFNIKDESYQSSPSLIQANIPQAAMYEKAYLGLRKKFADRTPVFLQNTAGRNDKLGFTDFLRERFIADGIAPEEIAYNGTLHSTDLDGLDITRKYVLIPSAGSLNEFNKMSHALKAYRDDPATASIEIFGYPDWTAFRGDAREMLHNIGATIYTRVFYDTEGSDAESFSTMFRQNFGDDPMDMVPNYAVLGRDVASMLIENLRANNGIFTPEDATSVCHGMQSAFHFIKPTDNSGFVNDALYIVTFGPATSVDTIVL